MKSIFSMGYKLSLNSGIKKKQQHCVMVMVFNNFFICHWMCAIPRKSTFWWGLGFSELCKDLCDSFLKLISTKFEHFSWQFPAIEIIGIAHIKKINNFDLIVFGVIFTNN